MPHRSLLGLLVLCLAAALPVHGWAMGTMARITHAVVLCTGAGSETAHVDWRGERVDLLPGCPDCMPAFGVGGDASPPAIAAPVGRFAETVAERPSGALRAEPPAAHWPRAPPV